MNSSTQLNESMPIPEHLPGHVRDVLSVVHSTVISRTEAHVIPDVETARKFRDSAIKALRTAYSNDRLTASQTKALTESTGLRHEQVIQFSRAEFVNLVDSLRAWFARPKSAKGAAIVSAREVQGALMDTEIGAIQSIVAGSGHGDRYTITIIKDGENPGAAITFDRGGRKAYGYYSVSNNTLEKKSLSHNRMLTAAAMAEGRARRIARELHRLGGDASRLTKSDQKWLAVNRDLVAKALPNS